MSAVAVGALLFALFLLIVAVMVLQELRRAPSREPVYVIEEVVNFAFPRLSDPAARRLDKDDVLRILEWEVRYLQGGAGSAEPPVAGSEHAVDFIVEKAVAQGHPYAREDVVEILGYEADYLVDIGALGPPVSGGE